MADPTAVRLEGFGILFIPLSANFSWMSVYVIIHLFSLRIGTLSTERGMGQFISAAAFKLRQSFSTSTDFIRIGSRVFIFDRRQWISAGAFNFGMNIQ